MRIKYFILSTLFVSALLLSPEVSSAQFVNGKAFLGPHIGLAAYSSAPAFGVNFETPITQPGKAGPGIIGLGARLDYFSYSYFSDWTFTWITVCVTANYHFALDDKTWDPFVGLGLGYEHVSWSSPVGGTDISPWGSGIFFTGNAGVRYFFSPNLAARAQVGFGITLLALGVDFGI